MGNTRLWKIPVSYCVCGVVYIEAPTLAGAIEIARDDPSVPTPDDAEFIDGTWEGEGDEEYVRDCFNDGEEDVVEDVDAEDDDTPDVEALFRMFDNSTELKITR